MLLLIEEVLVDLAFANCEVTGASLKSSRQNLEEGILVKGTLNSIAGYVNTVFKHKTEQGNLHVYNHHLRFEFEDFGDREHEHQVNVNCLKCEERTKKRPSFCRD